MAEKESSNLAWSICLKRLSYFTVTAALLMAVVSLYVKLDYYNEELRKLHQNQFSIGKRDFSSCECEDGEDGLPGAQGPPGETGNRGATGLPGPEGEPGEPGPQGEPGASGRPGRPGLRGTDGVPGSSADSSPSGTPGTPGRPEQTVMRWGRHSCTGDGKLLYQGYAVGMENSLISGPQKLLCIQDEVMTINSSSSVTVGPRLSEVKVSLLGIRPAGRSWDFAEGKRLPCVLCQHHTEDVMTVFGTRSCPSGWRTAYGGYSMTPYHTDKISIPSQTICVDENPDVVALSRYPNNVTSAAAPRYSFVRSSDSSAHAHSLVSCTLCIKN